MLNTVIGLNSNKNYQINEKYLKYSESSNTLYTIKNSRYIFKLLSKKSNEDEYLLEKKISYLQSRNINDLNILKPIEQIQGESLGYIIDFKNNLIPLTDLLNIKFDIELWQETGGLKKRLEILKNLSKLLSDLHSRGLVYSNLIPENIFISVHKESAEVYLIGIEDITHKSIIGNNIQLTNYSAPELTKNISGTDTYTDNYSFALIAYQLLTLKHPFDNDISSFQSVSINELQSSISKQMMDEFINTFETNILNKLKRTTASKWHKIFTLALQDILTCNSCKNTFFRNYNLECSFCQTKKDSIIIIQIIELNASLKNELKEMYPQLRLEDINDIGNVIYTKIGSFNEYIPILENDLYLNGSESILYSIKMDEKFNYIKGNTQTNITVYAKNKIKKVSIKSELKVSQGDWYIFSKDFEDNNYQRLIKVKRYDR